MDLKSTHGILGLMRRLNRDEGDGRIRESPAQRGGQLCRPPAHHRRGRYDFGPVEEVLTADHLRRIYEVPVVVDQVAGSSVVVVPR